MSSSKGTCRWWIKGKGRCKKETKAGEKYCSKHKGYFKYRARKRASDVKYNSPSRFGSGYSKYD